MADTAYREGDTEQRILRKILERVNQITSGGGGGGGTSPGGTNGQIQFNNAGAFGGLNSTGSGSVVRATSPTLAGTPLAPTATGGTNTTQIATTAFVQSALAGIVQVLHGEVANFAALPTASAHNGENYLVRQSQGVYFVNRKPGGIYTSNGSAWLLDGDATEAYFQDTLAWTNITSKPSTFAPSAHAVSHTDGTDDIQDATASVKGLATVAQITKLNGISAGADVTGAAIHAATAKTTPVDNDEFGLIDSAASNVLKKILWSSVKTTLKTFFDTQYSTFNGAYSSLTGIPTTFAPSAHAATHTNGADDIQSATASQKGLATSTQIAKLDGIAAGAQVNVALASQAEAEAGTDNTKTMTPLTVVQSIAARSLLGENAQTGTTYTLALSDFGKLVSLANASAVTLTIPPASSVLWIKGMTIPVVQEGAGQVTIAPGAGVTVKSRGGVFTSAGQDADLFLIYRGSDVWNLSGDLGP